MRTRRLVFSLSAIGVALSSHAACTAVLGLETLTVDGSGGGASIDASAASVGGGGGMSDCQDPAGIAIVLAMTEPNPTTIAVAGGSVYWRTFSVNTAELHTVSKCSGGTPKTLRSGVGTEGGTAALGTAICWAMGVGASPLECSPDGGETWFPYSPPGAPGPHLASVIVIQNDAVYWSDAAHVWRGSESRGIIEMNDDMPDAADNFLGLAVDDPNLVYWINLRSGAMSLAAHEIKSSITTVIAPMGMAPKNVAIDGAYAYWTDLAEDRIGIVARNGDSPGVFQSGESRPFGVAVDATHVYWTNSAMGGMDGTVVRKAKPAGAREEIATGQDVPWGLAMDDDAVYWTEKNGGRIWKWIKPR